MEIQITNKDLFFVLEPIWSTIDYRFKTQVHNKVKANSTDDILQTIDADVATFIEVFSAMNINPYGCTSIIADRLMLDLKAQLMSKATAGNEYEQCLIQLGQKKAGDVTIYEAKCASGKEQILA